MHRTLMAVAAVVVIAAAITVAAVVISRDHQPTSAGDETQKPGTETTRKPAATVGGDNALSAGGAPQSLPRTESPSGANTKTVPGPGPRVPVRPKDVATDDGGERAAGADPAVADARARFEEQMRKAREEAAFRLPSSYAVKRLEQSRDPSVGLTPDQREQVNRVAQQMGLKARDALGEVVTEEEALLAQMRELQRRKAEIQGDLEVQYRDLLKVILTPEQMDVVEGRRKAQEKVPQPQ